MTWDDIFDKKYRARTRAGRIRIRHVNRKNVPTEEALARELGFRLYNSEDKTDFNQALDYCYVDEADFDALMTMVELLKNV